MRIAALILLFSPLLKSAEYDLWVLAGQSNAQGWKGNACRYPSGDADADRAIPLYYVSPGIGASGRWIGLAPQEGRYKRGHFGPEVTFARDLTAAGRRVAVFKFSLGGTSLDRRWKRPGEGGLYDQMVAELRRAITALRHDGQQPRIAGLIWIQGESDAMDPAAASRYQRNLSILLRDFRGRIAGNPHLPVLLGVDEQHPFVTRRPIVALAQRQLAAADPRIRFVSMHGLPKADDSHLTPKGLASHGQRLARAALAFER